MKHITSLDALRGLAVLGVLIFHAQYLPFGWIGVPIFFVLSGYLITGILLGQKNADLKSYLSRFYWRRTVRIWPLYFLCIGIFALIYWKTGKPALFGEQWLSLVTFTLNFRRTLEFTGLGHLWSLSVEEQFYLIWPFAVYFLSVPALRRLLLALLACGPFIRLGAGVFYAHSIPDAFSVGHAVYTFSPSHFDAFAAGAMLTVLPESWQSIWRQRSGVILAAFVGVAFLAGSAQLVAMHTRARVTLLSLGYPIHTSQLHQYVWAYSVLNACSAALIFHLVNHANTLHTLTGRLFNNIVLVYMGKISYGLYVWHMLVLQFFLNMWPDWEKHHFSLLGVLFLALYLLSAIALASFSYWTFERIFLRWKDLVGSVSGRHPVASSRIVHLEQ